MTKRLTISGVVLLCVLIAVIFWWKIGLSPVNSADSQTQSFVIGKGDGVRDVANKLHQEGLIRDQVVFFILIKKLGIEKNIQAGSYKLSPKMDVLTIAQSLTLGTEDKWVTIVEGLRAEEILEQLQKEEIDAGKCPPASLCPPETLSLRAGEALRAGKLQQVQSEWRKDEGKLFPDTYLVPKEIAIDKFRKLMLDNYAKKITAEMHQAIKDSGRTEDEVLTLASLVEREGKTPEDRAMIADVLLKRLDEGMSLDVDATVQYAIGKQPDGKWWKKDLSIIDLKVNSPYNTYLNPGLPPAPICNPSLSAINGAIYPTPNPYFFYISDKTGVIHYAKTLDEHNQNVAKYL